MLLAILLSSPGFALGMQAGDAEEKEAAVEQEGQNPLRQMGLTEDVVMCLYNLAKESDAPGEFFKGLEEMILGEIESQVSFNLPIEMVEHIVDVNMIKFSSALELLKFLITFSSLNKALRYVIKPHIPGIVEAKFKVSAELTKGFLKLVKGRRGVPCAYMQELLLDFEKQQKIKGLRKVAKADLNKAIKTLETAVYGGKDEDAFDVIMSLPKEIFKINVGDLLKYLIDNHKENFLRMLIGSGINIDAVMIRIPFSHRLTSAPWKGYPEVPLTALMYTVYKHYIKMTDLLIKAGADVNALDEHGISALDHAIYESNEALTLLLKENGAQMGPKKTGKWSFRPFSDLYIRMLEESRGLFEILSSDVENPKNN